MPVTSGPWQSRVASVPRPVRDARATYDRLARWYDVTEAPFERRARAAGLRLLDAAPGERILEIGCGTGHTVAALAERVGATGLVIGADLSLRMLEVTRRRRGRRATAAPVVLVQADARRLPVADRAVDAITMSFTLDLIDTPDIPVLLGECHRALRPTGRLTVVSLDLPDDPTTMTRLYLAAHHRWPRLVDCRPLPVHDVLVGSGYTATASWSSRIVGIPVAAVTARPRGDTA